CTLKTWSTCCLTRFGSSHRPILPSFSCLPRFLFASVVFALQKRNPGILSSLTGIGNLDPYSSTPKPSPARFSPSSNQLRRVPPFFAHQLRPRQRVDDRTELSTSPLFTAQP